MMYDIMVDSKSVNIAWALGDYVCTIPLEEFASV